MENILKLIKWPINFKGIVTCEVGTCGNASITRHQRLLLKRLCFLFHGAAEANKIISLELPRTKTTCQDFYGAFRISSCSLANLILDWLQGSFLADVAVEAHTLLIHW